MTQNELDRLNKFINNAEQLLKKDPYCNDGMKSLLNKLYKEREVYLKELPPPLPAEVQEKLDGQQY